MEPYKQITYDKSTQTAHLYAHMLLEQPPFLLLRLPAELRNKVYEYVLGHLVITLDGNDVSNYYVLSTRDRTGPDRSPRWSNYRLRRLLAITRTNRQMHRETRNLVFLLNEVESYCLNPLEAFSRNLSIKQCSAIKNLKMRVGERDVRKLLERCGNRHVVTLVDQMRPVLDEMPGLKHFDVVDSMKKEAMMALPRQDVRGVTRYRSWVVIGD